MSGGDQLDAATAASLRVLDEVVPSACKPRFRVEMWNGHTWGASSGVPTFTLKLTHPGALRAMLLPPGERTLGEAYVFGHIDIVGDMAAAVEVGYSIMEQHRNARNILGAALPQ